MVSSFVVFGVDRVRIDDVDKRNNTRRDKRSGPPSELVAGTKNRASEIINGESGIGNKLKYMGGMTMRLKRGWVKQTG